VGTPGAFPEESGGEGNGVVRADGGGVEARCDGLSTVATGSMKRCRVKALLSHHEIVSASIVKSVDRLQLA
jgi:hypothetical protein